VKGAKREYLKIEEETKATMQLILPTILLAACASAEIAPWLAEPYTTSNQGYNGGEGYQSGQGGQGGQVAFHAQRASPYSRKGSPITFERSLTNLGGGWGRSGSIFTCPASGTYHFSWSALSSSNRELRLALVRSGEEVAASWADRDGYQTASGSAILNLRAGDTVWLELEEGEVYEPSHSRRGYASFNGYRIA